MAYRREEATALLEQTGLKNLTNFVALQDRKRNPKDLWVASVLSTTGKATSSPKLSLSDHLQRNVLKNSSGSKLAVLRAFYIQSHRVLDIEQYIIFGN